MAKKNNLTAPEAKTPERKRPNSEGDTFSSGLTVLRDVKILIPMTLLAVCNKLQSLVGRNEFSILIKGEWSDRGYVISNSFIVPKQEITGASVDYDERHLEELCMAGWNGVIHSHPFPMPNFSGADQETINSHFDVSILFSLGEFVNSTLNIDIKPGVKLQLSPKVDVDILYPELNIDITNIQQKTYNYQYLAGCCKQGTLEVDEEDETDPLERTPKHMTAREYMDYLDSQREMRPARSAETDTDTLVRR